MNPHIQRAQILFQQHRPDQAEESLRRALGEEPHSAYAHSLLALALAAQKKYAEAEAEAGQAIGLAPDYDFAHYARASVLEDRNKLAEAEAAIRQAVALDPSDADYHAMLAGILLQREDKEGALAAAEEALRFDPEHIGANNLRAMALTQLGRREEAGLSIEGTLVQNPDNALTHANRAWTLLHQGKHKEALPHFREALRLDPTNEWARAGCVEALKAGNPLYALMLRYFLWTSRLSSNARWGLLIGLWFGNRVLHGMAKTHPEWAPWIMPITALYLTFVLTTWLAHPLFNLVLRLSSYGRHLLSDDQRRQAHAVGVALAMALCWLIWWLFVERESDVLLAAGICAGMALPLASVFSCPEGWPRTVMTIFASILTLLCLLFMGLFGLGLFMGRNGLIAAADKVSVLLIIGIVGSTWLMLFLGSRKVVK